MKLRLRASAVRDLDGIFDYSLAIHGAAEAEAYIRVLGAAMERLLAYPEAGVARDLRPGVRSFGAGDHRIFYRIENREIVVVRILHKAMDVERHL